MYLFSSLSLSFFDMYQYITAFCIERFSAFNIVEKMAWRFISFLYKAYWDSLIVNDSNTLFKNMVKSKFSSQVVKILSNGKGKNIVKLASIFSILPPILAKSLKKVNEISKFFKKKPAI